MSNMENFTATPEVTREAKYRVKNAKGQYEVVYLETSANQVVTNAEKQFVSATEKTAYADKYTQSEVDTKFQEANGVAEGLTTRVSKVEADLTQEVKDRTTEDAKLAGRLTTLEGLVVGGEGEGLEAVVADVAKNKVDIASLKTDKANQSDVTVLQGDMAVAKTDISNLKDAVANKNNNTIVVTSVSEIATANPNPKIGDMAYVISVKKAYIYKGVDAPASIELPAPPAGWLLFDEITTEVDLVNYLKKTDAEALYRKKADKIAEADLATDLASKVNAKADKTFVSGEITRVEGLVSDVAGSLTEKETALKAEDTKINNRVSKFAPVIDSTEPTGTEAGHVWLEIAPVK